MNVWCMLWVWYFGSALARTSGGGTLQEMRIRCPRRKTATWRSRDSELRGLKKSLFSALFLTFSFKKDAEQFYVGGFWHKVVSMKYSYCGVRITPDLSVRCCKVAEARKDGSELRRAAFAEGTQLAVAWPFEALRKTVRWKEHLLTLFPKSVFFILLYGSAIPLPTTVWMVLKLCNFYGISPTFPSTGG